MSGKNLRPFGDDLVHHMIHFEKHFFRIQLGGGYQGGLVWPEIFFLTF